MGYGTKDTAYSSDNDKTIKPNVTKEVEKIIANRVDNIVEKVEKVEKFEKVENKVEKVENKNMNVSVNKVSESFVMGKNSRENYTEHEMMYEEEDSDEEDEDEFAKYVKRMNKNREKKMVNGVTISMSSIIENLNNRLMYLEFKSDISYEMDKNKYMNYNGILKNMRNMNK